MHSFCQICSKWVYKNKHYHNNFVLPSNLFGADDSFVLLQIPISKYYLYNICQSLFPSSSLLNNDKCQANFEENIQKTNNIKQYESLNTQEINIDSSMNTNYEYCDLSEFFTIEGNLEEIINEDTLITYSNYLKKICPDTNFSNLSYDEFSFYYDIVDINDDKLMRDLYKFMINN